MKYLLIAFLSCCSSFLFAQGSESWNGVFTGTLVGIESTLEGKANGVIWNGGIDAGGYLFSIDGSITGIKASGTIVDLQTGITTPFRANLSGDVLTIFIHDINPATGLKEDMQLVFTRGTTRSSAQAMPSTTSANIDPLLFGSWRFTDSHVSGQFSFATDYFMQFKSDGTILWTDGRTVGGGPEISMDSGSGDVHKASWKVENKVIWLNGGKGWEYYAKYYAEQSRLMLTFNNGNKQVWERI